MTLNKLKLNDSKTEFIIMGTASSLKKINTTCIRIGDHDIPLSTSVRNIGGYFDSQMKMDVHVRHMCKSAWHHLYNISKIRDFITFDHAKSVIHAYVTSKFDSNNSLLSGVPQTLLTKLQRIQNAAAKVITRKKKSDTNLT